MAARGTKHSVVLNGETETRFSNRTYTHALISRGSNLGRAARDDRFAAGADAKAAEYREVVEGRKPVGMCLDRPFTVAEYRGWMESQEQAAKDYRASAAEYRKAEAEGRQRPEAVISWHQGYANAQKAQRAWESRMGDLVLSTRIVEVTRG